MPISQEVFLGMKEKVEQLEKQRDEAIGAKKQILATLKKEFGVKTVAQAQRLLKKLRKEQKENESKFWAAYREFKKQYKLYLKKLEKPDNRLAGAFASGTIISKTRKAGNKK